MKRSFTLLLSIVLAVLTFSIILAIYEHMNGGPWYIYKTYNGDTLIMGANVPTTYVVKDESGKVIEIKSGWKFKNEPPDSYLLIKNSKGEYYFKYHYMPAWLQISDTITSPFFKIGHLIVDPFFRT